MAAAILFPISDFYVYVHRRTSDSRIFYVGKGRGQRAHALINRSESWHSIADQGYSVEFHKTGLSEHEAFECESALIETIGLENLTNAREGGRLGSVRKEPDLGCPFANELYKLKRQHHLSNDELAAKLLVSVKTVESWMASPGSKNKRKMPERNLVLLKAILGQTK